jgi:hypothetical protein
MSQRAVRRVLTFFALTLVSATVARSQSRNLTEPLAGSVYNTWEIAQQVGSSKGKLVIVTADQPNRRQSCHLQSFTPDELVCFRAKGRRRTYLSQQVAAIILPGDGEFRHWMLLLANGEMGAAIWGTVVLAATCPGCAVATGFVAASCLIGAWLSLWDHQPDRLLYLAPGQHLSRKFSHVKS